MQLHVLFLNYNKAMMKIQVQIYVTYILIIHIVYLRIKSPMNWLSRKVGILPPAYCLLRSIRRSFDFELQLDPQYANIATGETSQAITPFHFFDNSNFHQ